MTASLEDQMVSVLGIGWRSKKWTHILQRLDNRFILSLVKWGCLSMRPPSADDNQSRFVTRRLRWYWSTARERSTAWWFRNWCCRSSINLAGCWVVVSWYLPRGVVEETRGDSQKTFWYRWYHSWHRWYHLKELVMTFVN